MMERIKKNWKRLNAFYSDMDVQELEERRKKNKRLIWYMFFVDVLFMFIFLFALYSSSKMLINVIKIDTIEWQLLYGVSVILFLVITTLLFFGIRFHIDFIAVDNNVDIIDQMVYLKKLEEKIDEGIFNNKRDGLHR